MDLDNDDMGIGGHCGWPQKSNGSTKAGSKLIATTPIMLVLMVAIPVISLMAPACLQRGPQSFELPDEATRLKALDNLPNAAAQLLRIRLKTLLRGVSGVSTRNEAMLF